MSIEEYENFPNRESWLAFQWLKNVNNSKQLEGQNWNDIALAMLDDAPIRERFDGQGRPSEALCRQLANWLRVTFGICNIKLVAETDSSALGELEIPFLEAAFNRIDWFDIASRVLTEAAKRQGVSSR